MNSSLSIHPYQCLQGLPLDALCSCPTCLQPQSYPAAYRSTDPDNASVAVPRSAYSSLWPSDFGVLNTHFLPNTSQSSMPSLQSMNSAALVAAALGPDPDKSKPRDGVNRLKFVLPSQKEDSQMQDSSPLTDLSDRDFSSGTERRLTASYNRPRRTGHRTASDQNPFLNTRSQPANTLGTQNSSALQISPYIAVDRPENQRSPLHRRSAHQPGTSDSNLVSAQRLIRKKPHGTRVPQTLEEAGEADRMMWEWKNMGRGWDEIRCEWQRLTGIVPGTSTLSVRYIKLNENFARNGAAKDHELLRFKEEVEEELLRPLWENVAERMRAFSDHSEHNPKDLKKRYDTLMRSENAVTKKVSKASRQNTIKKEIKRERDYRLKVESDVSLSGDAVQMSSADPDHEEATAGFGTGFAPRVVREQESQSQQRIFLPHGIQDLSEGVSEADSDVVLPPQGGNLVTMEDDLVYGEYHEVTTEAHLGPQSSERPTSQLASSPFLRSLVAYLSDDEDEDEMNQDS